MFKEERDESLFEWTMLGDIEQGRPNLGPTTDVAVYRLMQFTLRDVLVREYGAEKADKVFYDAGVIAGRHFYERIFSEPKDYTDLFNQLQEALRKFGIGILRVEKADVESASFTITVAEDLDCSGLPVCDEEICTYDEGFISGMMAAHTGRDFEAKEVDCWCSGDRVCRFEVKPAS